MPAAKPVVVGGFVLGGLALGVVAILLFGGLHLAYGIYLSFTEKKNPAA